MPTYTLREYGTIYSKADFPSEIASFDEIFLEDNAFGLLKNFATENQEEKVNQVFSFHKKSGREFLKVKNFVGVVEWANGWQLEILPKIYAYLDVATTKRVFISMLKTLPNLPFIALQEAHLQQDENLPLLEIFIGQFLNEVEILLQKGLKSDYTVQEEAQPYLQGKILVSEDLKQKLIQPEQFYIQFQALMTNTSANRLIKTTLSKLKNITTSQFKIKQLLTAFQDISLSNPIISDLLEAEKEVKSYKSKHYEKIFLWVQLFLQESGWTNFKGDYFNLALLFPMQKVFEIYITHQIKKQYIDDYEIVSQEKSKYLIEAPVQQFGLQPDILVKDHQGKVLSIIDIKWKLLDESKKNLGIAEEDMYQIYVYGQKYNCNNLILIYPQNNDFQEDKILFFDKNQTQQIKIVAWKWAQDSFKNLPYIF